MHLHIIFPLNFSFVEMPDSVFGHNIDLPGQYGNLDETITGGICLMGETELVFHIALSCIFFPFHNAFNAFLLCWEINKK